MGSSLGDRLKTKGPIPPAEMVDYAAQVMPRAGVSRTSKGSSIAISSPPTFF